MAPGEYHAGRERARNIRGRFVSGKGRCLPAGVSVRAVAAGGYWSVATGAAVFKRELPGVVTWRLASTSLRSRAAVTGGRQFRTGPKGPLRRKSWFPPRITKSPPSEARGAREEGVPGGKTAADLSGVW